MSRPLRPFLAGAIVAAPALRRTPPGASAAIVPDRVEAISICFAKHAAALLRQLHPGGVLIVRIAGEGRWLLPATAEGSLRLLDNAVALAVDEAREDEYQRLLVGLCEFVRQHGELLEAGDHAGDADITVPPPDLPLDSAVDALFDGGGLSAESDRN
jgi:hypothetical protein